MNSNSNSNLSSVHENLTAHEICMTLAVWAIAFLAVWAIVFFRCKFIDWLEKQRDGASPDGASPE